MGDVMGDVGSKTTWNSGDTILISAPVPPLARSVVGSGMPEATTRATRAMASATLGSLLKTIWCRGKKSRISAAIR